MVGLTPEAPAALVSLVCSTVTLVCSVVMLCFAIRLAKLVRGRGSRS